MRSGKPVRPARTDRRRARRGELVDAAIAAIREHGAGASMEQLAAAGGVTKPILYRHFGDRDGLVRTIGERYVTELMGALREALGRDAEPQDILAATIDAYLAFVERDPDLYRFLVRRAGSIVPSGGELGDFIGQVGQEVTVVLGEQLRAIGLDSGPAEAWAYGMVGMVHLAGDWWLDRRTMPRDRLVTYLVDLLWHGLQGVALAGIPGQARPGGSRPLGPEVIELDVLRDAHDEANHEANNEANNEANKAANKEANEK